VNVDHAQPEVVVLILCHNGREYLDDCLSGVLGPDDGDIVRRVVVVDNASSDGSSDYIAENFPDADLVRSETNLGFAGGNNLGWAHIQQAHPDCDYLVLLNQDTIVESGWLRTLAEFMADRPDVGAAQPMLMMHPETDVINTAGNVSHYLGFGYCGGYRSRDRARYDAPAAINYASGAAVMLRAELLRDHGLFEEAMFMYLEDADVSWRLRQLGFDSYLVPAATVYHKYSFANRYGHYYHLEKNRTWLLGVYYRWPTLLLLAPAWALMELGQWIFALLTGLIVQKFRASAYYLQPANLGSLWRARRAAQKRRVIGDRTFLRDFSGRIDFAEMGNPVLKYVANPIFAAYWWLAKRLIVW